jgi:nicotinamide-nucleotide amidase
MPAVGSATPPELSAAGALARARVPAPLYDQSLPVSADDLVATLAERRETVALAESLTGGLLATQLTAVPGASQVVLEGQVVYTNDAKARLGLPPDFLCEKGAVSAEVARLLARRIRERAGSTWGVGLTGFAGPGGGTVDNPVGTYYCAVAGPEGVLVRRRQSGAARDVVRRAAAETARFLLAGAISAQPGFEWES